jgi:hypothetical protein
LQGQIIARQFAAGTVQHRPVHRMASHHREISPQTIHQEKVKVGRFTAEQDHRKQFTKINPQQTIHRWSNSTQAGTSFNEFKHRACIHRILTQLCPF